MTAERNVVVNLTVKPKGNPADPLAKIAKEARGTEKVVEQASGKMGAAMTGIGTAGKGAATALQTVDTAARRSATAVSALASSYQKVGKEAATAATQVDKLNKNAGKMVGGSGGGGAGGHPDVFR